MEAFTEENAPASNSYSCMDVKSNQCAYTAQGEYVCNGPAAPAAARPACARTPGVNYMERFAEAAFLASGRKQ